MITFFYEKCKEILLPCLAITKSLITVIHRLPHLVPDNFSTKVHPIERLGTGDDDAIFLCLTNNDFRLDARPSSNRSHSATQWINFGIFLLKDNRENGFGEERKLIWFQFRLFCLKNHLCWCSMWIMTRKIIFLLFGLVTCVLRK